MAAGDNWGCELIFFSQTFAESSSHPHLQVAVHAYGHPVGQHLLHNRLGAAQHQFGVLGGRSIDQIHQQVFHDARVVLKFTMEGDGEQGRQAASEEYENR